MINSMTGFGQGEAANELYKVAVELKSVNHRYLDLFFRLPRQYSQLEEGLRAQIQGRLSRGRVEVSVNVEDFGEKERIVQVNSGLLAGYLEALDVLRTALGTDEPATLADALLLPDVLLVKEPDLDWTSLEALCLQAAGEALDRLEAMRGREGESLQIDLLDKISRIEALLQKVAATAPTVVEDYRARLTERLAELLDGTTITEERFLGEVAIFAEKCSIDEELVRLKSHVQQFKHCLDADESIGRRLDFLLQEMNREVNTIGSKGNNVHIASCVVELKSELEKMREQVQNIE